MSSLSRRRFPSALGRAPDFLEEQVFSGRETVPRLAGLFRASVGAGRYIFFQSPARSKDWAAR